jgi:hypothetical protein
MQLYDTAISEFKKYLTLQATEFRAREVAACIKYTCVMCNEARCGYREL